MQRISFRTGVTAALAAIAACIALLAPAATAQARERSAWKSAGHHEIPLEYLQGITSDDRAKLYFSGPAFGLYRTDLRLREEARLPLGIPPAVLLGRGYSHIGDITWDRAEGGRILLPLECLGQVFCRTGAIGVADPRTLRWRYHVELDPAFVDKAMWAEASPDGRLLWTSSGSGDDLLAYDMRAISPANAWPAGRRLKPVRRLKHAVPPDGITGAAFHGRRLLLAGARARRFRIWSVDVRNGSRRLAIARTVVGESEGIDTVRALGGSLHWMVVPFRTRGRPPTYGAGHGALVHFARRRRAGRMATPAAYLERPASDARAWRSGAPARPVL